VGGMGNYFKKFLDFKSILTIMQAHMKNLLQNFFGFFFYNFALVLRKVRV